MQHGKPYQLNHRLLANQSFLYYSFSACGRKLLQQLGNPYLTGAIYSELLCALRNLPLSHFRSRVTGGPTGTLLRTLRDKIT